jgi:hypothetical protein
MVGAKQEKTIVAGTASKITLEFFKPLLAGARGDISIIEDYLTTQMASVQKSSNTTSQSSVGILFVLVSVYRKSVITTINHISIQENAKKWVEKVLCFSK